MNKHIKILLFSLLIAPYYLSATILNQRSGQPKDSQVLYLCGEKRKQFMRGFLRRHMPLDIFYLITYFVYGNQKYTGKKLPKDLSDQDLSDYDLTGCNFDGVNLAYTILKGATLTETRCCYLPHLRNNMKKRKDERGKEMYGDGFYAYNVPIDLGEIDKMYGMVQQHRYKAQLLEVAITLSRLPFYQGRPFYIKLNYAYCLFLKLKKKLKKEQSKHHKLLGLEKIPYYSIKRGIEADYKNYCWSTQYPQDQLTIDLVEFSLNFENCCERFLKGMTDYQCVAKDQRVRGEVIYRDEIKKTIKGLEETYFKLKDPFLQKEALKIAGAISKIYQLEHEEMLFFYFKCQNRIIRLKELIKTKEASDCIYHGLFLHEFR